MSGYVINVPIDSATEGPPFSLLKLEDAVLIAPLLSYDLIKRLPMASSQCLYASYAGAYSSLAPLQSTREEGTAYFGLNTGLRRTYSI